MKPASKKIILPALLIVAASVAFASAAGEEHPVSERAPALTTVQPNQVSNSCSSVPVRAVNAEDQTEGRVVLLTIRPTGFEPAEMTLPTGKYLLVVKNRTGLNEFSVRVDRGSGVRLYDVRVASYKRDWKQIVQIEPDNYVITETNHPEWTCRILVTRN